MKNTIPYLPDVDTSLHCFDCEVSLDLIDSWEPHYRLACDTGELIHVPICALCIGDSEDVATYDTMRVIFLYAKRERTRLARRAMHTPDVLHGWDVYMQSLGEHTP